MKKIKYEYKNDEIRKKLAELREEMKIIEMEIQKDEIEKAIKKQIKIKRL